MQLVKTLDAAVLGAVAALVRACMAWVRPQAKALRIFFEDFVSVMDGKRRELLPKFERVKNKMLLLLYMHAYSFSYNTLAQIRFYIKHHENTPI